jgi:putative spermidine/putrescine transport system permease protein
MALSPSGLRASLPLRLLLIAPNALLVGTFLAAILVAVVSSFRNADGHYSLALYADLLSSDIVQQITWRTVRISAITTLACVVLGYPLAMFIARARRRNLMLVVVISPWLTSIIVRTFGWIVILGNRGVVNEALRGAGLIERPIRILFTPLGTTIGLVHVLLPFMVISILAVLVQLDRRLMEAGLSLGAGPVETFLRITLPLSMPGVLSGCSLVYLLASGSIVTPILLGGLRDTMIGSQIYQEIFALFNFHRASALAVLLLMTSLVVIIPLQFIEVRLRRRMQA